MGSISVPQSARVRTSKCSPPYLKVPGRVPQSAPLRTSKCPALAWLKMCAAWLLATWACTRSGLYGLKALRSLKP